MGMVVDGNDDVARRTKSELLVAVQFCLLLTRGDIWVHRHPESKIFENQLQPQNISSGRRPNTT
jgi:hypothetical protein